MPFIETTHGAEVVINCAIGSIPFVNVFGYDIGSTSFTQSVADSIGTTFNDAFETLDTLITDTMSVGDCVVTDLRTETGGQFIAATFDPTFATSAAQALPFQTAALISWKTDIRGRSYRGRTYLGGNIESMSDGRNLNATLIGALQDFADVIVADGNVAIISRFHGVDEDTGLPIPRDPHIVTPITDYVVHTQWRTQRRRALANG